MLLLLAACSRAPAHRVVLLGLDGLERGYVEERLARGALPAFRRLYDEGVVADLGTQSPSLSPAIWTSLASGYPPEVHGVTGWTLPDGRVPSGADVRTDRIWDRVSAGGDRVVVSGWLMTWPATEVRGALVSERLVWEMSSDRFDPEIVVPAHLVDVRRRDATWPPELAAEVARLVPDEGWIRGHRQGWQLEALGRGHHPLPKDETHLRTFEGLWEPMDARLGAVYWMGIDQLSHLWWPFVAPRAVAVLEADPGARMAAYAGTPGDNPRALKKYLPWVDAPLTPAQLAEGRRWIEDTYATADETLSRVMALLDPQTTTLLVLSDHGFGADQQAPVLEARHRDVGFIAAWGARVRQGGTEPTAVLADVTPTLCGLLGIDAARDMPGRALTGLFEVEPPDRGESWTRSPPAGVPSAGAAAPTPPRPGLPRRG